MPLSISLLQSGTLSAATINNVFKQIEIYLNGGIAAEDLDDSKQWVTEKHIVRPEFYNAPSPRTLLASSDVVYRKQNNPSFDLIYTDDMAIDYTPIPGLCSTFYCDLNADETVSKETANALVTATWTCHGQNVGIDAGALRNPGDHTGRNDTTFVALSQDGLEHDQVDMASFRLIVNGQTYVSTQRTVHYDYGHYTVKNLSISTVVKLQKGMNDVGVAIKPHAVSSAVKNTYYQVRIAARNLHIEIIYR